MQFIEESEAKEQFDSFLDETNPEIQIGYITLSPSRVLAEVDPIAYNEGFLDWLDTCDLTTDESEADSEEDDEEE